MLLCEADPLSMGNVLSVCSLALVSLLAFLGRDVLSNQKEHARQIAELREKNSQLAGERIPQRVGAVESELQRLSGSIGEIKGDVKSILSILETGDRWHRRANDDRERRTPRPQQEEG